jgi:hypothetical protein
MKQHYPKIYYANIIPERLCDLVVRVPDYRSDSRHYQILWEVVGLERGPLSLLSTMGATCKK